MHPRDIPSDTSSLFVVSWPDPVIDQVGHDPRSVYVERFWLGILGPSATWLVRLLVELPDGRSVPLTVDLSRAFGPGADELKVPMRFRRPFGLPVLGAVNVKLVLGPGDAAALLVPVDGNGGGGTRLDLPAEGSIEVPGTGLQMSLVERLGPQGVGTLPAGSDMLDEACLREHAQML